MNTAMFLAAIAGIGVAPAGVDDFGANPNSRALAMRDPALAALLGVTGQPGADFGVEFNAANFGLEDDGRAAFGVDDFGEFGMDVHTGQASFNGSFSNDFGTDPGPMPSAPMANLAPTPAAMQAAWTHYKGAVAQRSLSAQRERILNPNKGSDVQIERYYFSINQTLTLGTTVAVSANGNPSTRMRPQRVTLNCPVMGFITVDTLQVANVGVSVGGSADGYDFNANGVGQALDCPTLTPADKATVTGNYTGVVPPGYVQLASYKMCMSFKGPSVVAGGG